MTDKLPDVITAYLAAHDAHDNDAVTQTFAPDAIVTDEGQTYHGTEEIQSWLTKAAGEYTYTTEFKSATITYDVVQHLEGTFPGGQVDLHYLFELRDGVITRLTIQP
ncbi:nuclear transport factor 2 family protein [Actinoplanes solisilvae]|uniref:nuclear transport factor 2 family protein n=1 Tax=Actinoplanes solisilvae TaxID=2486853 RepID=UPI000FDAEC82|nr:nuclear transport factor 2 family protein [Actinoplanes solisilvae]